MVDSGYHPVKHCPLRIVFGWKKSGYHPLKHCLLRVVVGCPLSLVPGWCTVDIILLSIALLG